MKSPETNGWQRDENNKGWIISVVIAAVVILLLYRIVRFTPPMLILVFIILILIFYQIFGFKPRKLSKLFSSPSERTKDAITQVLDEKGLPYDVANGRYYLIGSNLRIEAVGYEHKGLRGTMVQFVPYDGQNMPMIMSISGRLDEALAPKSD